MLNIDHQDNGGKSATSFITSKVLYNTLIFGVTPFTFWLCLGLQQTRLLCEQSLRPPKTPWKQPAKLKKSYSKLNFLFQTNLKVSIKFVNKRYASWQVTAHYFLIAHTIKMFDNSTQGVSMGSNKNSFARLNICGTKEVKNKKS